MIPTEICLVRNYDGTIGPDSTNGLVAAKEGPEGPGIHLIPNYVKNAEDGYGIGTSYCTVVHNYSKQRPSGPLTRDEIAAYGATHPEYPEAAEFGARKKQELEERYPGVTVHNVIMSTGIRELIAATPSGRAADQIFATQFSYNDPGTPWYDPSQPEGAMVGWRKPLEPQHKSEDGLRAILHGKTPEEQAKHPFIASPTGSNDFVKNRESVFVPQKKILLIVLGDGSTDDYAADFALNRRPDPFREGAFLAVYEPGNEKAKAKAEILRTHGYAEEVYPADYRAGTPLDIAVNRAVTLGLERLGTIPIQRLELTPRRETVQIPGGVWYRRPQKREASAEDRDLGIFAGLS